MAKLALQIKNREREFGVQKLVVAKRKSRFGGASAIVKLDIELTSHQ